MSNKTADGLRDRLFDALDAVIEKKISTKEVEAICYVSEQIIKTAQTELEIYREQTRREEIANNHTLAMKREEKETIKLLGKTIQSVEVLDEDISED